MKEFLDELGEIPAGRWAIERMRDDGERIALLEGVLNAVRNLVDEVLGSG
jgi:hypothetical protein